VNTYSRSVVIFIVVQRIWLVSLALALLLAIEL